MAHGRQTVEGRLVVPQRPPLAEGAAEGVHFHRRSRGGAYREEQQEERGEEKAPHLDSTTPNPAERHKLRWRR
jgi:hypothetical protein